MRLPDILSPEPLIKGFARQVDKRIETSPSGFPVYIPNESFLQYQAAFASFWKQQDFTPRVETLFFLDFSSKQIQYVSK
jgi:hypothetical protein